MEELTLLVLAGTAMFFVIQIIVEIATLVDHRLIGRRTDRR